MCGNGASSALTPATAQARTITFSITPKISSCRGNDISQVELREFELAVGAQIFIAKTFHDLKVFVQPGDHQDLLENLGAIAATRRIARDAHGWAREIACAFRSRTREHGRFDFDEAHFVHDLAHFENDFVTQRQVAVRLRTAQVEIAEAQARLFRRVDFVFDRKRRRLGVVENMQLRGHELDFPAGQFRIGFLALDDLAFHGDDEFAARLLGFRVRRGLRLFVEDRLHDAGAITNIEKEQIAKVAPPRHPAHDQRIAPVVLGTQFAAVVCAL